MSRRFPDGGCGGRDEPGDERDGLAAVRAGRLGRQAGLPGYKLADPLDHEHLLHMAYRDAAVLLSRDPKLESPRGRAVRLLLNLFERNAAMRTLAAG